MTIKIQTRTENICATNCILTWTERFVCQIKSSGSDLMPLSPGHLVETLYNYIVYYPEDILGYI